MSFKSAVEVTTHVGSQIGGKSWIHGTAGILRTVFIFELHGQYQALTLKRSQTNNQPELQRTVADI